MMKNAQITPLTMDEFVEVGMDPNEIERVEHGGMTATKFINHYEYGDIILLATFKEGGLMLQGKNALSIEPITEAQLADIIVESGELVETSSHAGMDINCAHHPRLGKVALISTFMGNGDALMVRH